MGSNKDITDMLELFKKSLDRELNSIFYNNLFLNTKLKENHQEIKDTILTSMNKLFAGSSKPDGKIKFQKQLPLVWSTYQSVCIKWFYDWKFVIKERKNNTYKFKDTTVEFRILKTKLGKVLKIFHKFYYQILEYIACHFDTSAVIPTKLISDLNLEGLIQNMPHLAQRRQLLQPTERSTTYVLLTFYYCLLYLGKIRYHQTVLEGSSFIFPENGKEQKQRKLLDFKKAARYWLMASVLLPSMGETYKHLSKLSLEENNFSKAIYFLIRCHFASGNKNKKESMRNIIDIFQGRKWEGMDKSNNTPEVSNLLQKSFEIMRHYLFTNETETKVEKRSIQKDGFINNLKDDVLLNCQRNPMFIDAIFNSNFITILVGVFVISKKFQTLENKTSSLPSQPSKANEWFLDFILNITIQVISEVNNRLKEYDNLNIDDMISLLAILRVINCWIISDKTVLSYVHRYKPIYPIMCEFILMINQNESLCSISHVNKRPGRQYLFEEDVILREFTVIDCNLSDFNDSRIFEMENVVNRLIGDAPKANILTKKEEFHLRLKAVVTSMKRFIEQNKCDIKLPKLINTDVSTKNAEKIDTGIDVLSRIPLTQIPRNHVQKKINKPIHKKETRHSNRKAHDSSFFNVPFETLSQPLPQIFQNTDMMAAMNVSSSQSQILSQGQIPNDMLRLSQSQSELQVLVQVAPDSQSLHRLAIQEFQLETQQNPFNSSGWFEGDETPIPLGQQQQVEQEQKPKNFYTSTQQ
ncbi:Translation inhibition and nonsense-mediated decay [Monosporozyma unispora]|nr:Translation inhibition and nonsense-mediated decay [Kazachstania unispora]